MDAATGQEHRIASLDGEAMKTLGHRAGFKADVKLGSGISVGDVPHLGLRLAAELRYLFRWRMDLKRKFFARVQNFDEQRKSSLVRAGRAEQLRSMRFDEPMKVLACQR